MGQFAGLQLGCADAPSCSPQGRKALQKRPQDSRFPPSSLQACAGGGGGYHECRPGGHPLRFPTKPRGRTPSSASPPPCQLKPARPQVAPVAQLGCVPALFSVFFLFFFFFVSPPHAVSAFPPAAAVTKGAAGSHDSV